MKNVILTLRATVARVAAKLTPVVAALTALVPILVHAQEAAPAFVLPSDPTDLGAMAKLAFDAVINKQWGLLAALLVTVTVASLRKFVPETTKVGTWLRSKLGGIITNFVLSLSGAFSAMLMSGAPFSVDLVFKAVSIALTASGGWAIYKNISEAVGEAKAAKAGVVAAETPAETLNK